MGIFHVLRFTSGSCNYPVAKPKQIYLTCSYLSNAEDKGRVLLRCGRAGSSVLLCASKPPGLQRSKTRRHCFSVAQRCRSNPLLCSVHSTFKERCDPQLCSERWMSRGGGGSQPGVAQLGSRFLTGLCLQAAAVERWKNAFP